MWCVSVGVGVSPAAILQTLWDENAESIISFLEQVNKLGVRGIIQRLEQKRCVIALFIVFVSSAFSLHGCAPPLHAHNLYTCTHSQFPLSSSSLSFQVIEANVTLGDSQSQFVIRSDSQFGSYCRLLVCRVTKKYRYYSQSLQRRTTNVFNNNDNQHQ